MQAIWNQSSITKTTHLCLASAPTPTPFIFSSLLSKCVNLFIENISFTSTCRGYSQWKTSHVLITAIRSNVTACTWRVRYVLRTAQDAGKWSKISYRFLIRCNSPMVVTCWGMLDTRLSSSAKSEALSDLRFQISGLQFLSQNILMNFFFLPRM